MSDQPCRECDGTGRCAAHTEPECMTCADDGVCPYCLGTGRDFLSEVAAS